MDNRLPKNPVFGGRKVAYFSMEVGLIPEFHTYSGGLGVLAGDTIRSSADLKVPLIAITPVNRMGYFRQELTGQGKQIEHPDPWSPETYLTPLEERVEIEIEKRTVKVMAWLYVVEGMTGGQVPVLFLDTDIEGNSDEDRLITSHLYGGDRKNRLKQEIVLGVGGVRMLDAIGVQVQKFHLNEGHASLLILELMRQYEGQIDSIREKCVFTTHTPVEAGHDKFSYDLVDAVLPQLVPLETLKRFAGSEVLNLTLLALNMSDYVNGVARRHKETTELLFPGRTIRAITNGIHARTWTHPAFRRLYDKYLPGWANEPELLTRAPIIPDSEILAAHQEAKQELVDFSNRTGHGGGRLSAETFTIGFARRATKYKRHALLFSDLERLRNIDQKYAFQLIFAGKAHPDDEPGKQLIEEVFALSDKLRGHLCSVYLENYDMTVAAKLVSGVDLWLNTPEPPMEASGTSGMKAALNGILNFSVLDGWWIEGCIEGVTGWAIGPHSPEGHTIDDIHEQERHDLYGKLEFVILPDYYEKKDRWVQLMQQSISKIAYYFNSHRMMRRYITEAYFD